MAHHVELGRRVGDAFVAAVAQLHALEPAEAGLGDLGKPEGFCARQVAGWAKRWELARPDPAVPSMDAVGALLAGAVPEPQRVSILHNDLHLGNCQFDPDDPDRVKSIFDWDMSTIGDPLFDFGGLLAYWRDGGDAGQPGDPLLVMPSKEAAVERYAERTGLDLSTIAWYHGFAIWKIAIIRQQLYNRYQRGESNDARLASFADSVEASGNEALALLERG
jgi:aminoglycoside phosphotransferase (APT) family kinase protein